jgi:hypothetical protein
MHRPSKILTRGVLCATITVLAGCAARAQRETAVALTPATVDSVGTRLVRLELQRVRESTVQSQQRPQGEPIDVDAEIADLYARLRALPDGALAEREMRERVLAALDARAVSLKNDIGKARQVYMDSYPLVRQMIDEARRIGERRAELSAGVPPSVRPPATRQASSPR